MTGKTKIQLAVYTLCLGLIICYPAGIIKAVEFPSEPPVEVKFRVMAYDPYDPFRGRYVAIRVVRDSVKMPPVPAGRWDAPRVWAVLEKDAAGFARIVRFEPDAAAVGDDERAIPVKLPHYGGGEVRYPFTHYYVNEHKAPELEKQLRDASAGMVLTVQLFRGHLWAVKSLTPAADGGTDPGR